MTVNKILFRYLLLSLVILEVSFRAHCQSIDQSKMDTGSFESIVIRKGEKIKVRAHVRVYENPLFEQKALFGDRFSEYVNYNRSVIIKIEIFNNKEGTGESDSYILESLNSTVPMNYVYNKIDDKYGPSRNWSSSRQMANWFFNFDSRKKLVGNLYGSEFKFKKINDSQEELQDVSEALHKFRKHVANSALKRTIPIFEIEDRKLYGHLEDLVFYHKVYPQFPVYAERVNKMGRSSDNRHFILKDGRTRIYLDNTFPTNQEEFSNSMLLMAHDNITYNHISDTLFSLLDHYDPNLKITDQFQSILDFIFDFNSDMVKVDVSRQYRIHPNISGGSKYLIKSDTMELSRQLNPDGIEVVANDSRDNVLLKRYKKLFNERPESFSGIYFKRLAYNGYEECGDRLDKDSRHKSFVSELNLPTVDAKSLLAGKRFVLMNFEGNTSIIEYGENYLIEWANGISSGKVPLEYKGGAYLYDDPIGKLTGVGNCNKTVAIYLKGGNYYLGANSYLFTESRYYKPQIFGKLEVIGVDVELEIEEGKELTLHTEIGRGQSHLPARMKTLEGDFSIRNDLESIYKGDFSQLKPNNEMRLLHQVFFMEHDIFFTKKGTLPSNYTDIKFEVSANRNYSVVSSNKFYYSVPAKSARNFEANLNANDYKMFFSGTGAYKAVMKSLFEKYGDIDDPVLERIRENLYRFTNNLDPLLLNGIN